MRKFGAITLASFYLLLTTGIFVCLVHCSAGYMFARFAPAMAMHNTGSHHVKKPCKKGKDCSCCNQHATYVVKENVNDYPGSQITAPLIVIHATGYQQLAPVPEIYHRKVSWLHTTGPPGMANYPLYIYYRSLLI